MRAGAAEELADVTEKAGNLVPEADPVDPKSAPAAAAFAAEMHPSRGWRFPRRSLLSNVLSAP